jgi:osmotically-inducible protein OsmY
MKKNFFKFVVLASLVTSTAISLQGCLFPVVAGGMVGGAMVYVDRRPVSVVAIDRGLQLEIESFILQKYGNRVHVNVNVYNQKVLLTGETRTEDDKSQIEAAVKERRNIKNFVNEIQVGPLSSVTARVSDNSLYALIKGKFVATTDIPSNSMKIVVEAGKVYLLGLATELEAKAAAVVASQVSSNVKEVVKLFDIISDEERDRLDKERMGESQSGGPRKAQ